MIIGILAAITFLFGGGIFTFDYARDAAEEFIKDNSSKIKIEPNR